MTESVISVKNLSKSYLVGHNAAESERYTALRDVVARNTRNMVRKTKDMLQGRSIVQGDEVEEFWALKEVSFEIKQGDRVGIIGRNGAGKSTLLKILSRITEPTTGRIRITGRVASLLEVGTGFHPELSGRENIFLNGAILGMARSEIQRKFDEIVDFAEVEKFLDTPVKRYSSGMYVRLAFAVAAYLEPEILIVDEVLAVGDAQFQKKCLGKMGEASGEGRTVLFVSHNMASVQQLCDYGMVLNDGKVDFYGGIEPAINYYLKDAKGNLPVTSLEHRKDRQGSQWLKFTQVGIFDTKGNQILHVMTGEDIVIKLHYESKREMRNVSIFVSFNVRNSQGYLLTNLNSFDSTNNLFDIYSKGYFQCFWKKFNLRSDRYECNLFCRINGEIVDWMQSAFIINVEDGDFYNTGRLISRDGGDVLVSNEWSSHNHKN
jgi:lipopolysaccharide transport system ATP-binding protein